MGRRHERVQFEGSHGEKLAGQLHRPAGPVEGAAVFAHCFTCSKDLRAARRITEAVAERGFVSLRFDFTGLGQSGGAFEDTTFASNVGDLVAAARWLEGEVRAPTLLVGHSLGGAAVYRAAAQLPSVRAVASIGAPADPSHVEGLFADHLDAIEADGQAEVSLAGRPFTITRELVHDLRDHQVIEGLRELRRAVLVLHSPQDDTVGVDNARALFEAAWHPKSFVSLDGADHLLTDPADAAYVGEVVASWARRYAAQPASRARATHDDDVEVVTADRLASSIVAHGVHHLRADEPVDVGGEDTGPTPFELVSAGLGACTSMTLRMVADRKGWPLEEVRVHVRHDKEPVDGERPRDVFDRVVELSGALDDDQRRRLLEIADRCPVHRALHGGVTIRTKEG